VDAAANSDGQNGDKDDYWPAATRLLDERHFVV
jgi:hypothetical protein